MSGNRCIICGRENTVGLSIMGRAICQECEKNIISSDANDHQYDGFISRLRDLSETSLYDDR